MESTAKKFFSGYPLDSGTATCMPAPLELGCTLAGLQAHLAPKLCLVFDL